MAGPKVSAPSNLTFPAGVFSISASLTLSSGDSGNLSIGGIFSITKTGVNGSNPQTVSFTLSIPSNTPRGGSDTQQIGVVVGPNTVNSNPITINF